MARLAFGLLGAAIGSFFGMPQIGFLAGSLIGGLLFPENTTVEGPRLGDKSVTSSAYGAFRTIGFGTLRMGGNIIWATPIQEVRKKKKSSKFGKGSVGQTTTTITYSYFGNWAVGFGEGEAEDVLRIWADGKLIYDKTGTGLETKKTTLKFRFYRGTDDQDVDPLIAKYTGDLTPAYRDECFIIFDNCPLADYGNRIPTITAEITYHKTTAQLGEKIQFNDGAGSYQRDELCVDWDRGNMVEGSSGTPTTIYNLNIRARQENTRLTITNGVDTSGELITPMPDGTIVVHGPQIGNQSQISKLDPETGIMTTYGDDGPGLGNTSGFFVNLSYAAPIVVPELLGPKLYCLTMGFNGQWGLLDWQGGQNDVAPTYVCDGIDYGFGLNEVPICRGAIGEGYGDGYVFCEVDNNDDGIRDYSLRRIRVTASVVADPDNPTPTVAGIEDTEVFDFRAAGLYPEVGGCRCMWFDETDNSVIILFENGHMYKLRNDLDDITYSLVWRIEDAAIGSSGPSVQGAIQSILRDGRLGYMIVDTTYLYDTTTGALISTQTGWDAVTDGVFGTQVYNSETNCIVYNGSDGGDPNIVFLDRGNGEGETLGDIVTAICTRTGLTTDDVDATDLDDEVHGYLIGKQMSARAALEPLAQAFFFYGVESDFQLKFIHNGGNSVVTINESDLAVIDDNSHRVVEETRRQELELPQDFDVVYIDKANAYQTGDQHDKRIKEPEATMQSDNPMKIELPIVFTADEARAVVERALYQAWVERVSVSFRTSWKYLYLNPGDAITVVRADGTTYQQRVAKNDFNGDMSISLDTIATDQVSYEPTGAPGGGGENFPQIVSANNFSRLFIPNLPLLRDVDDNQRQLGVVYFGMSGYGQPGWRGGVLYRNEISATDPNYEALAQATQPVIWGFVSGTMSAPEAPESFDHDTEITVFLTDKTASLSSVSYAELLQGANAAAIGKDSIGWEVFQFQNATQNDDGSWTLTDLFRGRRGTEYLCDTHGTGEMFILLELETIDLFNIALDRLNLNDYYKPVGFGMIPEDTIPVTKVEQMLDLKPWSPVQVTLTDGSSSSLDISWLRRTRIHGSWIDGTEDVPLNEDTEEYKVEIINPNDGTIARTFTGIIDTTTQNYTHAQLVSDLANIADHTDDYTTHALTVTNPSADVDVSGWTNTTGTIARRTTSPSPHSGAGYFFGGTTSPTEAYQNIDISAYATSIDAGVATVDLTWWQAGDISANDTAEMALEARTSGDVLIGSRQSAGQVDEPLSPVWVQRTLSYTLPANTRYIRLIQRMIRNAGVNNDGYIDDIAANIRVYDGVIHHMRVKVYQKSTQVGYGIPSDDVIEINKAVS